MATIGLRGATIAQYTNNNGVVTYGTPISGGCARRADLQLQFAEGELWGCDGLRAYLRAATGGTITFEATFFTPEMQMLAFGATQKTREITYTNDAGAQVTENISSVVDSSDDDAPYVGFAIYSPDMINHQKKWSAIFVACAKFSPPNTTRQTRDNSIVFQTPTTTGRFLPDKENPNGMLENILQALAAADFTSGDVTPADSYDRRTKDDYGQHYVIECEYCDGGVNYGDCQRLRL